MKKSCLYVGRVRHRRFTPREHKFSYKLFLVYLDLSELPSVFDGHWLWSIEKVNIASFRRSDHLGDKKIPLDISVRDHIETETGRRPEGPIRLLTHLSYFGFRFNPVSFYYCFDKDDTKLEFIVAEVNNTPWGEQYCYVLDSRDNQSDTQQSDDRLHRYFENKRFHVSPFMPMDMQYDWRLSTPGKTLSVHMENHQHDKKVFDATNFTMNKNSSIICLETSSRITVEIPTSSFTTDLDLVTEAKNFALPTLFDNFSDLSSY